MGVSLPGYKPKHKKALWVKPEIGIINGRKCKLRPIKARIKKPLSICVEAFPEQFDKTKAHTRKNGERRAGRKSKYRGEAREYIRALRAAGQTCIVVQTIEKLFNPLDPHPDNLSEVHHKAGRIGRLLRFTPAWLPVSRKGHKWIHNNIDEARLHGWICPVGIWNDYEKAVEYYEQKDVPKT